jgi:hypothetical protein
VAGQPVQASQPIRAGGAGGTELQATIPEPPSGGGRGAGGGGRGVNVGALIIIGTSSSRHATHLASRLLPLGLPLDLSQRLPRAFAHTSELLRDKDCARATRAHPKSKTQRPQEKEAGKRPTAISSASEKRPRLWCRASALERHHSQQHAKTRYWVAVGCGCMHSHPLPGAPADGLALSLGAQHIQPELSQLPLPPGASAPTSAVAWLLALRQLALRQCPPQPGQAVVLCLTVLTTTAARDLT